MTLRTTYSLLDDTPLTEMSDEAIVAPANGGRPPPGYGTHKHAQTTVRVSEQSACVRSCACERIRHRPSNVGNVVWLHASHAHAPVASQIDVLPLAHQINLKGW